MWPHMWSAWRGEGGCAAGNSWRRRLNLLSTLGLNSPAQMDTEPALPAGGLRRGLTARGTGVKKHRRWVLTAGAAGGEVPGEGGSPGGSVPARAGVRSPGARGGNRGWA